MFIPLRGLGSLGVIHDSQSQALPIGAWKDARNMRFSGLSMEKMLEPTLEAAFSNTTAPPGEGVYACDAMEDYFKDQAETGYWSIVPETTQGGTVQEDFVKTGNYKYDIETNKPGSNWSPNTFYRTALTGDDPDFCPSGTLYQAACQDNVIPGYWQFKGKPTTGLKIPTVHMAVVCRAGNGLDTFGTLFWNSSVGVNFYTQNNTVNNTFLEHRVGIRGATAYQGSGTHDELIFGWTNYSTGWAVPFPIGFFQTTKLIEIRVSVLGTEWVASPIQTYPTAFYEGFVTYEYEYKITDPVTGITYQDSTTSRQEMFSSWEEHDNPELPITDSRKSWNNFIANEFHNYMQGEFWGYHSLVVAQELDDETTAPEAVNVPFDEGAYGLSQTWSDAHHQNFLRNYSDYETPKALLGEPKWMQGWSDGLSSYVAMAATGETGDYLWFLRKGSDDDGVWEQAGGPYDSAGQWQSFAWGDTCIFNNGLNPPQIYNPNTARFEDLPNWGMISTADDLLNLNPPSRDTYARCRWIVPFKSFLVAGGVTENGVYGPNTVWWSDATNLAGYSAGPYGTGGPPDWDYESPGSLSGKAEIGVGDGRLEWGHVLNESLICYNTSSATAMQVVGGSGVMDFRRLFNKGCAGLNLVAEYNNLHFVLSRDQIYTHDGSTVKLLAKDRVEDEFFKRAGKGGRFGGTDLDFTKMQVVKNPDRKEINVLFDGEVEVDVGNKPLELLGEYTQTYASDIRYRGNGSYAYWGNVGTRGMLKANGKGMIVYASDGFYEDPVDDASDESNLAISHDFGETWELFDCKNIPYTAAGFDAGSVNSIDYDPILDRWYLLAFNHGNAAYTDDNFQTFSSFPQANVLGDMNSYIYEIACVPGTERFIFGGRSDRGYQNNFSAAGYWNNADGTWRQSVCRTTYEGSNDGIGLQAIYYNGRHLLGVESGILEPHVWNGTNSFGEWTYTGGFSIYTAWATKGDGIILQGRRPEPNQPGVRIADCRVTGVHTLSEVDLPPITSGLNILSSSITVAANEDYYVLMGVLSTGETYATNKMAFYFSEDGHDWTGPVEMDLPATPQNDNTWNPPMTAAYAGNGWWVVGYQDNAHKWRCGRIQLTPTQNYQREGRFGLVYNFEDDNYTWMDAAVDTGDSYTDVAMMHYTFNPGYTVRWSDLTTNPDDTWGGYFEAPGTPTPNLITRGVRWSDFYSHGSEQNMYWLAADGIYRSDQRVKTDGIKDYFVVRDDIDLDDVVQQWNSHNYKFSKQAFFHIEQPYKTAEGVPNPFNVIMGAKNNLMDDPSWRDTVVVNLNKTANSGKHKADYRVTGRYLAMKLEFNETGELRLSGAEMDAEESHGR